MDPARCASYHFGPWMIEPEWMRSAVESVRCGIIVARGNTVDPDRDDDADDDRNKGYQRSNGVALIPIAGAIMKPRSKFGGTSSIDVRHALRKAVNDDRVAAIVLHIDSPGGTHAGIDSLATDVASADAVKPVYAHADDMLCSAAYYVASQARRITASRTSLIGSLGSRMALVDSSEKSEREGLRVIDLSTGEFKGTGLEGTKITDRQLAYIQTIVDASGEAFKQAVMSGRHMTRQQIEPLFDGRMHDADVALQLGLIDAVVPLDVELKSIQTNHPVASGEAATVVSFAAAGTHDRSVSYAAQQR